MAALASHPFLSQALKDVDPAEAEAVYAFLLVNRYSLLESLGRVGRPGQSLCERLHMAIRRARAAFAAGDKPACVGPPNRRPASPEIDVVSVPEPEPEPEAALALVPESEPNPPASKRHRVNPVAIPRPAPAPSQPGSAPAPSQPGSAPAPSQPGSAPAPSRPQAGVAAPAPAAPPRPSAVTPPDITRFAARALRIAKIFQAASELVEAVESLDHWAAGALGGRRGLAPNPLSLVVCPQKAAVAQLRRRVAEVTELCRRGIEALAALDAD